MSALDVYMTVLFLLFGAACYLLGRAVESQRRTPPPRTREEIPAGIEAENDARWKRAVEQVAARRRGL